MVNSVLYDLTEDGKAKLTLEIMNPAAPGGQPIIYEAKGATFAEAVRQEMDSVDKNLFAGFNRARLFSEKLAKSGLNPLIDFVYRNSLTDETPLMILVKDEDPQRFYLCETGLSDMMGNYLESLSKTQQMTTCESVFITTLEFEQLYYQQGIQPVMGLVQIIEQNDYSTSSGSGSSSGSQPSAYGTSTQGKSSEASSGSEKDGASQPQDSQKNASSAQSGGVKYYVFYEGLAAFKEDKLVGYMNGEEARAYNILRNQFTTSVLPFPYGKGYITCLMQNAKTKIDTKLNGLAPEITVTVKTHMSISQIDDQSINIMEKEVLKKVEQKANATLQDQLLGSIQKAQQQFESDIFGFGIYMHSQHPQEWKEIKYKWDNLFVKAKINVKVETTILTEGSAKQPMGQKVHSHEQ